MSPIFFSVLGVKMKIGFANAIKLFILSINLHILLIHLISLFAIDISVKVRSINEHIIFLPKTFWHISLFQVNVVEIEKWL